MITRLGAFEHLLDRHIVELEEAKFYLDFYKREVATPKTVGAKEAKESVSIWMKRISVLENHIKLLKDYCKRNKIRINELY